MDRSFNTLLADINSCVYVTRQSTYKEKIQQCQDHLPLGLCLSAILVPREVKCSYHPGAAVSAGTRSAGQHIPVVCSSHPAPISRDGSRDVPTHHETIITARSHQQQLCQLTMRLTRGICSEIWDYKVRTMLY